MGIKIIVEILDHYQGAGLTLGECHDLIVLAENANDATRETFGPVHEPYILRRAGNKSAQAWKNSIGKLIRKGALAHAVHDGRAMTGHVGRHAVYRIPPLCPDVPHDGLHGHCTRPERVTQQVTQPAAEGHLTDDPTESERPERVIQQMEEGNQADVEGSSDGCGRVIPEVTPTPLVPQETSSVSSSDRIVALVRDAAAVPAGDETKFIDWMNIKFPGRGIGWWRAIIDSGDIHTHAADWKNDRDAAPSKPVRGPWCGTCDETTRQVEDPATGRPGRCGQCHPLRGEPLARLG